MGYTFQKTFCEYGIERSSGFGQIECLLDVFGKRQTFDHHNFFHNKPIRFHLRTTQELKGKSQVFFE